MKPDFLNQPDVQRILTLLDPAKTRIVGGAVRDALMDRPVADIDLATMLTPHEVMARAKQAGVQAVPTGLVHGTVTLVLDKRAFEVTTLRHDTETDGRHAVVAFGQDWVEDAHRRDFTMNALYLDAEGTLYDEVGGRADIEKRRVRFIGNAEARIREDYLRILRFFRFQAVCGLPPYDTEALAACAAEKQGLAQISRERIRHEFLKTLSASNAIPALEAMQATGVLDLILPQANLALWTKLYTLEIEAEVSHDPVRGLAALREGNALTATETAKALRLSNDEKKDLTVLAKPAFQNGIASEAIFKEQLYTLTPRYYSSHVLLAAARGNLSKWQAALDYAKINPVSTFLLKGKDIIAKGIPSGPLVGLVLAHAESLWKACGLPHDSASYAAILDDALKNFPNSEN